MRRRLEFTWCAGDRARVAFQQYLAAFDQAGAQPHLGVALEHSATGVVAARASGALLITVVSG